MEARAGSWRRWIIVAAGLAMTAVPAQADVSFTQRIKVKTPGSIGSIDISRTVRLSGMKERDELFMKLSNPSAEVVDRGRRDEIRIVRPDKDLVWELDPKEQTYTETTFPELRARMERMAQELGIVTKTQEASDAEVRVETKWTKETKRIGPWEATKRTIIAHTQVVDLETGLKRGGEVVWDLWLSGNVPGQDEMRTFSDAYRARMGLANEVAPLWGFAGAYAKSFAKAIEALKELDGYPVRWSWSVRTELSPEEKAAFADEARTQAEGADDHVLAEQAGKAEEETDLQNTDRPRDTERAETKKTPRPVEPEGTEELHPVPEVETGMMVQMRASSTLEKVDVGGVAAATFELPSGYQPALPAKPASK